MSHFEGKYIQAHKKKTLLKWELSPIPSIYSTDDTTVQLPASAFPTITPNRKPPLKRNIQEDELQKFLEGDTCHDISNFNETHCPNGFLYTKLDNSVNYYNLNFTDGVPKVKESIFISGDLNVPLSYEGIPVPLPEWLRSARNCKMIRFSQLLNLPAYIQSRIEQLSISEILEEIRKISYYKPQGRPPYSAKVIRYCLLLRYTSRQAYELLLNELPLPSFSLLEKLCRGFLDALKVAKVLLHDKISKDCILMFDEMYLQKSAQYQGGKYIGADECGELFKGIVCFMIVGLKESVATVVKAVPEISVNGDLIAEHLFDIIPKLSLIGFNVRGVVCDDHSSNVRAFDILTEKYGSPGNYFIYHPSYKGILKTYLFFDSVHLIKNIRNNLLAKKKFVFLKFSFHMFKDSISVPHGFIEWSLLHSVYDKDQSLDAHFQKAYKLTFKALHPGDNKQSVPLALAIYHESTAAALRSYYPHREDAAAFLNLINIWWTISNSKSE